MPPTTSSRHAQKRKAFVHVGLDDGSGDVVDAALSTHAHALLELGVRRPTESSDAMFRAALEVLGTEGDWGYQRAETDGAFADVVRRADKGRETVVISQPLLAAARPADARRLVEGLTPFEVHAVVTVQAPDAWTMPGNPARDLVSVLDRWSGAVGRPDRLHVVVGGDRVTTWKAFGRVVGFGTSSLRVASVPVAGRPRLPDVVLAPQAAALRQLGNTWAELLDASPYDVVGDLAALEPDLQAVASVDELVAAAGHALDGARHEVERLSRRNDELERRLAKVEKKKRKLKRRLSEVA